MGLALRIAALVLFILAAILAFGWFGSDADALDVIGIACLGLAAWVGSTLWVDHAVR